MKVTDKDLYIEPRLKDKLDLMIKRSTGKNKDDNVLLVDGEEGMGKSNMAALCAYYIHYEMKRPFDVSNMFFNLDELLQFAIHTKEQIIVWDEAALGGLAVEWWRKNQLQFIKLLMIARKKRHFMIICIPKFFKLNEYIAVDRSIGLIHVYAANAMSKGRFVYYNKDQKEYLYEKWRKTRTKVYRKYYNFHGRFLEVMSKVLDELEYDKKKDAAIMQLGGNNPAQKVDTKKELVIDFMKRLDKDEIHLTQKKISELFGYSKRNIERFAREIKLTADTATPY